MRRGLLFSCVLFTICTANASNSNPPVISPSHRNRSVNIQVSSKDSARKSLPPIFFRAGGLTTPTRSTLITVGCLLAANSGFLNGLALTDALVDQKQAVAAVTGAYTTSAISLNTPMFQRQVSVIASYLGGSCINGLLNPFGINWMSSAPPTSLLCAALLVLAAYYATTTFASNNLRIWCLLALANGLQNSWTSMLLQGNVLRTAHFSGITSDMGTFCGQIVRGNTENAWKLRVFAALASCFWMGGLASVSAGKRWGARSLWISIVLYLSLWAYFTGLKFQNEVKKWWKADMIL